MRFVSSSNMFLDKKTLLKNWLNPGLTPEGEGGRFCQIWAIWVCAAVKGMVFKQFTLG